MSEQGLLEVFKKSRGRWSIKWEHYFEVYERHLSKYRNQEVHLLEFGVYQGGSLQIWKQYFGEKAHIYGVDINPECKKLEEERVKVFIGDQEDPEFLRDLIDSIPKIDIAIDDGGHTMKQQITTFKQIYDAVEQNGVYICEDLHTSFWEKFGGGISKKNTFINFSKTLIDKLHTFHVNNNGRFDLEFCSKTDSLHFYDSMLVVEKRRREKPREIESGMFDKNFPSVPLEMQKEQYARKIARRILKRIKQFISS